MKRISLLLSAMTVIVSGLLVSCSKENPNGSSGNSYSEWTEYNLPMLCDSIPATSIGLDVSAYELPDMSINFDWTGLGSTLIKSSSYLIGYYIGGAAGGAVANQISPFLSNLLFGSEPAQEVVLLNQVLSQLDVMDEKLDKILETTEALYKKMDEVQLNQIMAAFKTVQQHYLLIKQLNDFTYAKLATTSDEALMTQYINEWAATDVKGSAAYLSVMDLAQKIKEYDYLYNSTHINYCAAADLFVFSNAAWECSTYDYREAYRAQIAAELARSINLLLCYYDIQISTSPFAATNIQNIQKEADSLAEFFEESAVVRNPNAVCILPGHNFEITPDAFDNKSIKSIRTEGLTCSSNSAVHTYQEWFWAADGAGDAVFVNQHYGMNFRLNQASSHVDAFVANCLKHEDVEALINYFQTEYKANASMTLADIFAKGGVDLTPISECGNELMLGTTETYILPLSKAAKYASPIAIALHKAFYLKYSLKELWGECSSRLDQSGSFNQYGTGVEIYDIDFGKCYTPLKFLISSFKISDDGVMFLKEGSKIN